LRSSNYNQKRKVGDTDTVSKNNNNNNNTLSKLLCMASDDLKNDLASILYVRSENLVEKLCFLLNKLNGTGVEMDESLTVGSKTDAAEAAAVSVAAVSAVAAAESAPVSAAALLAVAGVSASAERSAVELLQPLPVVYSNYTRPAPFQMIEFDKDAFKVADKYGKLRSDGAARMGKCRAVNRLVNTILGDYFSTQHTPEQLVLLALREASKHPDVRMLFKSEGLTDVEDLEALQFHHDQIYRILKTTNDSKKKGGATDDVRSYEQSIYSAMAESPISSNCPGTVPSIIVS
jgi:hypothetical protein